MCINDLYSFFASHQLTPFWYYYNYIVFIGFFLLFVLMLQQAQHKCFDKLSTSSKSNKKIKAVKYLAKKCLPYLKVGRLRTETLIGFILLPKLKEIKPLPTL